jgi:predicted acylesterase/phospholipase RssA
MRQIDLEVMTTNLTLRRPYRFPFESRQFFFCEECFKKYFPQTVVDQMTRAADPVPDVELPATDGTPPRTIVMCCPLHPATRVRHLPRPPDIPVVVAARLSLSFPGLISAVPMCYVDYGRAPAYRNIIVVWFSDGGIASNFPMHLFDTLWPTRPTFGINLEPLDAEHGSEQTRLPKRGFPRSHEIASIPEFVQSLLDTMQNWVDTTQLTMSTYRNRGVEVRLTPTQGGMNLRMPDQVIEEVAALGEEAAALFDDFDLSAHQKKRFLTAMTLLDAMAAQLQNSDLHGFHSIVMSEGQRLRQSAEEVLQLAERWEDAGHPADSPEVPRPTPDLRLVPRE